MYTKYLFSLLTCVLLAACTSKPLSTDFVSGQKLPDITAVDINGKTTSIKQLAGEKGLILVFFRSADWCPFCKSHLKELNQWNDKFNQLGYKVAAISYDDIEILKSFTEQENIQYTLIADQNNQTFKDYNLLNTEYTPQDDLYGIPYPGVMLIDSSQKLVKKYFYKGYTNRVDSQVVYEDIKNSAASN